MSRPLSTKRRAPRGRFDLPVAMVLLCCANAHADDAGGDPRGERNLAATSTLPRGDGLAAAFIADRGIAKHPAVIFADDFESPEWRSRWDEIRDPGGKVLSLVDDSAATPLVGSRSLRVRADIEGNTGGGATKWFEPVERVHIRFYTKFAADCDYVHHFVTLRANRGLRGKDRWSGFGGAGARPEGDERFSTAIEPWGDWGRIEPPGRWNFYSYWHEMKASPDGKYWGNAFRPAPPASDASSTDGDGTSRRLPGIEKERWISVEFLLVHNQPGRRDGEHAYWIDGELRGHWKGIDWRKSPTLFANALTLESYVTDRWTKNRYNTVWFDDVVIAREYIGPAKATAEPSPGPASDQSRS